MWNHILGTTKFEFCGPSDWDPKTFPPRVIQHEKPGQWASTRGTEEGGCGFRLKKARIYVELQLQSNPYSRRVVNTGRWILQISVWRKIFWVGFVWSNTTVRIHVRECVYRRRVPKTQWNLVCLGFSRSHGDGCRKALIFRLGVLVVIQERCLRMNGNSDTWGSLQFDTRIFPD